MRYQIQRKRGAKGGPGDPEQAASGPALRKPNHPKNQEPAEMNKACLVAGGLGLFKTGEINLGTAMEPRQQMMNAAAELMHPPTPEQYQDIADMPLEWPPPTPCEPRAPGSVNGQPDPSQGSVDTGMDNPLLQMSGLAQKMSWYTGCGRDGKIKAKRKGAKAMPGRGFKGGKSGPCCKGGKAGSKPARGITEVPFRKASSVGGGNVVTRLFKQAVVSPLPPKPIPNVPKPANINANLASPGMSSMPLGGFDVNKAFAQNTQTMNEMDNAKLPRMSAGPRPPPAPTPAAPKRWAGVSSSPGPGAPASRTAPAQNLGPRYPSSDVNAPRRPAGAMAAASGAPAATPSSDDIAVNSLNPQKNMVAQSVSPQAAASAINPLAAGPTVPPAGYTAGTPGAATPAPAGPPVAPPAGYTATPPPPSPSMRAGQPSQTMESTSGQYPALQASMRGGQPNQTVDPTEGLKPSPSMRAGQPSQTVEPTEGPALRPSMRGAQPSQTIESTTGQSPAPQPSMRAAQPQQATTPESAPAAPAAPEAQPNAAMATQTPIKPAGKPAGPQRAIGTRQEQLAAWEQSDPEGFHNAGWTPSVSGKGYIRNPSTGEQAENSRRADYDKERYGNHGSYGQTAWHGPEYEQWGGQKGGPQTSSGSGGWTGNSGSHYSDNELSTSQQVARSQAQQSQGGNMNDIPQNNPYAQGARQTQLGKDNLEAQNQHNINQNNNKLQGQKDDRQMAQDNAAYREQYAARQAAKPAAAQASGYHSPTPSTAESASAAAAYGSAAPAVKPSPAGDLAKAGGYWSEAASGINPLNIYGGTPIGSLAAAMTPTRSLAEQAEGDNGGIGTVLQNLLIPGVGPYRAMKRLGTSIRGPELQEMQGQDRKKKKTEKAELAKAGSAILKSAMALFNGSIQ